MHNTGQPCCDEFHVTFTRFHGLAHARLRGMMRTFIGPVAWTKVVDPLHDKVLIRRNANSDTHLLISAAAML